MSVHQRRGSSDRLPSDPSAFLSVLPTSIACFQSHPAPLVPKESSLLVRKRKSCLESDSCSCVLVIDLYHHVVTRMRAATALSLHSSAGEGHSSSSVFVHASFACILGIRRPQFRYMPRSHVYRGRCSCLVRMYLVGEHNVYRGVDKRRRLQLSRRISWWFSWGRQNLLFTIMVGQATGKGTSSKPWLFVKLEEA